MHERYTLAIEGKLACSLLNLKQIAINALINIPNKLWCDTKFKYNISNDILASSLRDRRLCYLVDVPEIVNIEALKLLQIIDDNEALIRQNSSPSNFCTIWYISWMGNFDKIK